MVDIAIVETDTGLRTQIRKWINDHPAFSCTISEPEIGKFFERLDLAHPPDILLMDLNARPATNLDQLKKLKMLMPSAKFMIYTQRIDDHDLLKALKAGINAVKISTVSPEDFFNTLQLLADGEDFIDPSLSTNIMKLFRNGIAPENPVEARWKQYMGLLNQREIQVVRGLSNGQQYKEIATDLFISINTVRHYVKSVYKKFEVNNKVQLLKKLNTLPASR